MPRSVNHVASRAKRKRILKLTKGYFGARKNVWTVAKNTWEKGLTYAYRDRKNKKRTFRALWIQRIMLLLVRRVSATQFSWVFFTRLVSRSTVRCLLTSQSTTHRLSQPS